MDLGLCIAALEAQFLMGHRLPSPHLTADHTDLTTWSWDVDDVRQALHVPRNDLWDERVLALESAGLTSLCLLAGPPENEQQPREDWAELSVYPAGVLHLATLYGRPYVRYAEAPTTLLAHWRLVQAEATARLVQPYDEARFAQEWPERALYWQARRAQLEREFLAPQGDDEAPEAGGWL